MPRANAKFGRIYDDLMEKIRTGELKVGESLPPEVVLAREYGVAVLTLRRALARLREEGLIVSRPRHGSQVVATTRQTGPTAKGKTIALLASGHANALMHPPTSRLFSGVEEVATATGYALEIFFNDGSNATTTGKFLKRLEQAEVQGWLIPTALAEPVRRFFRRVKQPVVLVNYEEPAISGHVFQIDYSELSYQMLRHLLEQGRSHIWLFTHLQTAGWDEAIRKAAEALGVGEGLQCKLLGAYSLQVGQTAMEELLAQRVPVDAVVCSDDEVAAGVIQALQGAGVRVPDAVSVIGGGDFPIAALMNPPLTTVNYPHYNIGREAGRLLIDLVEGHEVPPVHRLYLPKFVIRKSSQPALSGKRARGKTG